LGITTDEINVELNKIRKIRNLFAHAKASVSLDTEPIKSIFYTLARPPGITGRYLEQFVKCGIGPRPSQKASSAGNFSTIAAAPAPVAREPIQATARGIAHATILLGGLAF
jgi:hypothetical protein